MNFILKHDLLSKIKNDELAILTENSVNPLEGAELTQIIAACEQEIKAYITHRHDVALAMPPLWYFDPTDERATGDRVYLYTETQHDAATEYGLNDLVHGGDGRVYRSLIASNTGNAVTDVTSWAHAGALGRFYTSLQDDNDTDPIDPAAWTDEGAVDPRNALLKDMHIDLVLYKLHARIKPRQIPEHRIGLRDDAIAFLRDCADPRKNTTLDLPLVDHGDQRGVDMSFGGNQKTTHTY